MDKKEARDSLRATQHYNAVKNPQTPPKMSWWNVKNSQPMQITRQSSTASDGGTSSPVGSPLGSSPITANFTRQLSRSHSSDDHKDSVLT